MVSTPNTKQKAFPGRHGGSSLFGFVNYTFAPVLATTVPGVNVTDTTMPYATTYLLTRQSS